jgi:hypothetical protein
MIKNESEGSDDANRNSPRKPEFGVPGDSTPANARESVLARAFAERALAPLVTDLRSRQGLLLATRIAAALGLTLQQFADCMSLPLDLLRQSPPLGGLEERLEPFAMVIAIVRDVYGSDDKRVRLWLRTPRPELDGKTPNEALCEIGGIHRVTQFVLSAWLKNAD